MSARFTYQRITSSGTTFVAIPTAVPPSTTVSSNYGASGSVGAQYALGKRFGVFGELGFAYSRSTVSPGSSTFQTESKNTTLGLRSGVGVILYFGS